MLNIKPQDRQLLTALLERFLPHTQVWAYGSRVKGRSRPCSDLDLIAFTTKEQRAQVSLIKEAFAESNLPFRVDMLEWDTLPESSRNDVMAGNMEIITTNA